MVQKLDNKYIVVDSRGKVVFVEKDLDHAENAIQYTVNNITEGGNIVIKKANYNLDSGISIQKNIQLLCEPRTQFIAGTSGITMFEFKNISRQPAGIYNATINLNNLASCGLLIEDAWSTMHDGLYISGVGENGIGIKVLSSDNNWLCLMNWVRCRYIQAYGTRPSGSIGVQMVSESGINLGTNLVLDVGYLRYFDIGIEISGNNCELKGIVEGCNTGIDIKKGYHYLNGIYEEASVNYGLRVRSGARVVGTARYLEKSPTIEGAAFIITTTGTRYVRGTWHTDNTFQIDEQQGYDDPLDVSFIIGARNEDGVNSGRPWRYEWLFDASAANGNILKLRQQLRGGSNRDIMKFYRDLELLQSGRGVIVTTPDGTKKYRIRVDNSGNVVTEEV
ncbi:MAG: hypothetical protein DRO89_05985 [Candidatus Altiarchaeales archaeon]|nr:MAG: hypothetical protein DRO89_05985 [Candidatus Altiarchaeales archaeon]